MQAGRGQTLHHLGSPNKLSSDVFLLAIVRHSRMEDEYAAGGVYWSLDIHPNLKYIPLCTIQSPLRHFSTATFILVKK